MQWEWEEVDETRSGSSGDISKLFKNEHIKRPGVLEVGAPHADATIMAREVIQNAWDAARDLRDQLDDAEPPDFDIDFHFERLQGDDARSLSSALDFSGLVERASAIDWAAVGLPHNACLKQAEPDDLRVLRIEEHGSSGMYGPWTGAKSKMYLAMVTLGYTFKMGGSGGSYGYGKAGLIRGSQTRTVVAYSCFREQEDDPGVTRRLLGMTYWGPHEVGTQSFTGFARLGHSQGDNVEPFVNADADTVAERLGISPRDPVDVEDLGTTFLLLDPTVSPTELKQAVERNWWPALEADHTFGAEIIDYDGEILVPQPKQSPVLATFIRAFEIARASQDNTVENERRFVFQPHVIEDEKLELGSVGLVADRDDWSYPSPDDDVDHRSLVALIRSPHMVVEYYDAGRARPYVRGAFVADNDIDDFLRQTEPRGHDAWQAFTGDDSTDPRAPKIADTVLERIRSNVRRFRNELKPPVPDQHEIRLPDLERLFRMVLDGDGTEQPPPPPPPPRLVGISISEQKPEIAPSDAELIRLRARVSYMLSDNYVEADTAKVRLIVRYRFVEDDRAGEDCPLILQPPDGFELVDDNTLEGLLGRSPIEVAVLSEPYDANWTGRLVVEGDVVEDEAAA